ncbi:MAG TPA: glucokinase [Thiobacillaceae bacterium]|nr:glucokinase [Thiobacillaceae bacterium]
MPDDLVLAGDIGGTKSDLAFFRGPSEAPETVAERTYQNRDFAGLGDVARQFFADTGQSATTACFGVAGAVLAGESTLPNLGWRLSERELGAELGLKSVYLINDLEANAIGLGILAPEQCFTLNVGQPRADSNRALIAAGTGLGMAMLVSEGKSHRILASEGGHADFAPCSEEQVALWRFLAVRYGRVSVERVVSGPGLVNIYEFLKQGGMVEPDWLARQLSEVPDRAAVVAQAALRGEPAICVKALDLFLSCYGAAAGNLALMALATGGLYIGGGIAPKLLERFPHGNFMAAFTNKGRFAGLMAEVPVRIILEPRTALLGAARAALQG